MSYEVVLMKLSPTSFRAGFAMRGVVMAALVLMASSGQVLADGGPVNFNTTIKAQVASQCSLEIVLSDAATSATYTRGGEWADGVVTVDKALTQTTVKYVGNGCYATKASMSAAHDLANIDEKWGVTGIKAGATFFPVSWQVADITAASSDVSVDRDQIGFHDRGTGKDIYRMSQYSSKKMPESGPIDAAMYKGSAIHWAPNSLVLQWSKDAAPRFASSSLTTAPVQGWKSGEDGAKVSVAFPITSKVNAVTFQISTLFGDGLYDIESGKRSEEVAEGTQSLNASATMTYSVE